MTTLSARRTAALAGSLAVLVSASACGSSANDGAAEPDFPATFHAAHRLAQVAGDKGQTSVTMRLTPKGLQGTVLISCTGAPKGAKALFLAPGQKLAEEGDFAVPCSAKPPKPASAPHVKWFVVPRYVGKAATFRLLLVTTHVDEGLEEVVAKPVKDAPDVRLAAAAYSVHH